MPNVLLINPWIYDFTAFDLWMRPLGLLYIAGLLRERGYDVHYIDCLDRYHPDILRIQGIEKPRNKRYGTGKFYKQGIETPEVLRGVPRKYGRYGITPEIFRAELERSPRPDAILVTSGMTYWYLGVFEAINMARQAFGDIPIILGGIYATLCYEHALMYSGADAVVRGEGEAATLGILDEIFGRRSTIPRCLDDLPYPAHDLVRDPSFVPILTSRGCPFDCPFCASNILYKGFRRRDPIKVADEIEHFYKEMRIEDFVFYDDALLVDRERHFNVIMDEIIRRGMKCRFHTPNGLHTKLIDEEVAERMFAGGFKTVRLSFETVSEVRQREMRRKIKREDLAQALENLERAGFRREEIEVYVLIGLPGQPFEEMAETVKYVRDLGAVVRPAKFSPIPGTPEFLKSGLKDTDDPLLQNKTAYSLLYGALNPDALRKIKELCEQS